MSKKARKNYSRRQFIQLTTLAGSGTALGSLLAACSDNITPTSVPGTTPATTTQTAPTVLPVPTVTPLGQKVDGYLALAPAILRSGLTEQVSVTLFSGTNLGSDNVEINLLQGEQKMAQGKGLVQGRSEVGLSLPAGLAAGNYTLQLKTPTIQAQTPVKVQPTLLLFVETDKPIYKPGQTVHIRVLTLDVAMKPQAVPAVTVDVADAKGTRIFKKSVATDEYGMATLDLPLSSEPNLGTWQLTASAASQKARLDVRVEKYTLPKFEITINTPQDWVQAGDKLKGTVRAEYSYGKPVTGEAEIRALKYVGTWQEYAKITRDLDGQTDFEIPPVNYVAGTPAGGGQGNITLEVTVREKATGYEEKTTRLLTVTSGAYQLKLIPENLTFKPGLPLNILAVAETPDKKPVNTTVTVYVNYQVDGSYGSSKQDSYQVTIKDGLGELEITPPAKTLTLTAYTNASPTNQGAYAWLSLRAGYSPTGSFISLKQVSQGTLKVGDTAQFKVQATKQATNFYYEITSRGTLVYTGFSNSPDISYQLTPQMAPQARLLVYQILPNAEVAADYLPFQVEASYPHQVQASFDQIEVEPGKPVKLQLQTSGPARLGLSIVDRSVFILAENRLNLQQVFDELEKLYQKPQIEVHDNQSYPSTVKTYSSQEMFESAGLVVMSNKNVPQGQTIQMPVFAEDAAVGAAAGATTAAATTAASLGKADAPGQTGSGSSRANGLAEPPRVRQFFPETWLWDHVTSDSDGKASKALQAPDTITTWMLNAIALSPKAGLGVAEAQLKVLQPFFIQADLPYSVVRGEEFPAQISLYNYGATAEDFQVELEKADWFDLLESNTTKTVRVGSNDLAGVSFRLRPKGLGTGQLKVTARSSSRADAIIKDLLVEPEGVAREQVENLVIAGGQNYDLDVSVPGEIVQGSDRRYLAVTGNYMTQTLEGLDKLVQMPYGCGEQNMILFAPDVSIGQYLKETDQIKPEIQARLETFMLTGYQRELTYRRNDGSFSAFGNSDQIGSLWLTAFVLKTFEAAKGLIYIDEGLLDATRNWLLAQQKGDGSFEPVGFLHHQDLMGGLKGKTALTAFLAVALLEGGVKTDAAAKTVSYLEKNLGEIQDNYTLALTAYALELGKSSASAQAYDKLVAAGKGGDDGLYWPDNSNPVPLKSPADTVSNYSPVKSSAAIETTGYALMALMTHGDRIKAGQAARWLVGQRNAYGGWESTQDTVVGLQALAKFVATSRGDIDATITVQGANGWSKQVQIGSDNADVLQMIELPASDGPAKFSLKISGRGQALAQTVRRYNVAQAAKPETSVFQVAVSYSAEQIAVNDKLDVKVDLQYNPPQPQKAGMVLLDVALPTGFALVEDSLANLVKQQPRLKRYETAGRKVILYIEDMAPGDKLQLTFQAQALYPVKAQSVTSQAYSYYRPEWRGESLAGALTVIGR